MPSTSVTLNIERHAGQRAVFEDCTSRRRVVSKGRRWGFTRGAAQYMIEQMIDGTGPNMWGDTVSSNIYSYVERYFLPILNKLPDHLWDWKKQEKKLYINNQVLDFRSADQPENWEGFGYKNIVLNEAGIILKNQYLWNHAVRPMLMDYPDSIAIIGGTPKGKNLFYELWLKERTDKTWKAFQFSSYTNPYLSKTEIDDLVRDLPNAVVRQEIYAEFTDLASLMLIPYELVDACMISRVPIIDDDDLPEIWGLDVARHGDDVSCLARRYGPIVYSIKIHDIPDTMQLASFINFEYQSATRKPYLIFIETTGIGWGVYDRCRELGCPVFPADVSLKSTMPGVLNKRAEMYVRLKDQMKKNLKIIEDPMFRRQASNQEFTFNAKGQIKLQDKDDIKKLIGESPNNSDAVALTFFEEVTLPEEMRKEKPRERYKMTKLGKATWMSR